LKLLPIFIFQLFLFSSCTILVKPIAGNFSKEPQLRYSTLSNEAKKMIDESFSGIDFSKYRDVHVHLVGLGNNNNGAWVNPEMREGFHLYKRLQFAVYMNASGIQSEENSDNEYIERLVKLIKGFPKGAKFHLFAFDKFYEKNGKENLKHSSFYIPNDYLLKVVERYPGIFVPVISIHPYRTDAIEKLKMYASKGIRFVKWLPNAMGIDPSDEKSVNFLKEMKTLDMTLITHVGEEKAVEGDEFQAYGNPLLFRKALEHGTNIIMSHLASLGDCKDVESADMKMLPCYDLFWRLFKDERYKDNLFADLSGITIHTRTKYVFDMLKKKEYHHRFIHGSDYPLPAINLIYRTGQYAKLKLIPIKEREILNEIYDYNPLVFDFVVKRRISFEDHKFLPSAFEFPDSLSDKNTGE